jgi:hypothetical protein
MFAGRSRQIVASLLGALGVLLIITATLLGYATRSLFDDHAFASRVAASLEDPRVANYAAERIVDAVIRTKPDLVGLRPVLVGVARSVVSSSPFRAAVRRSARALHHAVMSGTGTNLVLDVQDLGVLLESAAETNPKIAEKIPPQVTAALGHLRALPGGERALELVRFANRLRFATVGLFVLGMVLCAAAVWLTREKRRGIVRIGVALAGFGLVLAIAARFGGSIAALFPQHRDIAPALAGLADAFLKGLMLWAGGLGFAGLVLAAAAASLLERVPMQRWAEDVRRWLTGPQPLMRVRLARGIVGAVIGAALLVWPLPALTVLGWLAGLVVAFAGLREAFVAALHLMPEIEAKVTEVRTSPQRRSRARAVALVSGITIVLLGGAAWWVNERGGDDSEPEAITACNGSPTLCDRTLDQVIFPCTHNSMGGADLPGWMFPNQDADIPQQLTDGIRGFLIDVHYGVPVGDKVETELQDEAGAMAQYESAVGKEGMEAAVRIRDRLSKQKPGPRDVYLCHGFCELGAERLIPVLKQMHDFLVANPGEVLMICVQDEGVTPQDVARCFEQSGLIDFVYKGPAHAPWPTLRQMVESDQRVLVTAEHNSEGVDWYHPAFEVMQETPYEFHDPSQFSNQPGRGGTSGSLYLLNHWIETVPAPKPSNAAIVNSRDELMKRIRGFERERGHIPNFVAVDFYKVGDLIPVVRELNERPVTVRGPATASR